ncbi:MAG: serine/threonine protein kinase [Kofleriaceae bacterium]|nr:serine/threonine protein kinase [Myxococcales bacterium]MCB9561905.1 serine/threonine protein kinase [Kofleriaceae bacterium]MCB9573365.1 serine/threonine protein kinase [Kofleriaceae bacterium]
MASQDPIGAVLDGRYRVVSRIADGAMGAVFRGERIKLGRAVAIKFLHAQLADEPRFRQRFEIEARTMAKLDHPHCGAVIDVGQHGDMPYLVMEFIQGVDLRHVLDDGRLAPLRAAAIARQVLAGLAHAHEVGIIHRDVKPANVMLADRTGLGEQVRLLDFGLARLREQSTGLTVGIAIGTPAYMAPEQATSGPVDHRTDLYACGVLLFEMLTGDKPFVADEPVEILRHQLHSPPPRLADKVPGVDFGGLEQVVAKAMAKAPADRYGSALEMAAALDDAIARLAAPPPTTVAAPPPPPAPPIVPVPEEVRLRRRRLTIAGAVTAAILAIGLIARLAS